MARLAATLLLLTTTIASAQTWPPLTRPPAAVGGGQKDAALIVTVQDYATAPDVVGAEANGRAWLMYLTRSRGIPASRVKWLRDQEAAKELLVDAARQVAGWADPGGTVWFVFVGHGAPAPDGKDGVLVGYDAQQNAKMLYSRSVRQRELLQLLAKGRHARTVAVIDACFSGQTGSGGALAPGLQPFLAAKTDVSGTRATVLSAGTNHEFAGPLPGAARPAFSYLVLGALRGWGDSNHDGQVTASEAVGYAGGVLRTLVKGRTQTPQVAGPASVTLARPGRRAERGPDLVAMQARPTPSATAPTFGQGLGPAPVVGSVGRLQGDLPTTSLSDMDVTYLKLLQAAKRADRNEKRTYHQIAAAWEAVVRYRGKNPMKAAAAKRRDEWRAMNDTICNRRAKADEVRARHATDKAKLEQLLSLDDDVVGRARKQALKREFTAAYAPWKALLGKKKARSAGRAQCSRTRVVRPLAPVPAPAKAAAASSYDQAMTMGTAAAKGGDHRGAIKHYEQALKLNARSVEPLAKSGYAYLALGDSGRAIQLFQAAKRKNPGYRSTYIGLGKALELAGRNKDAIKIYRQYVRMCPNCRRATDVRASIKRLTAKPDRPMSTGADKARKLVALGHRAMKNNNYKLALLYYRKAKALHPSATTDRFIAAAKRKLKQ